MIRIPQTKTKVKWVESRRVAGWPARDDIAARTESIRQEWSDLDRNRRALLLDDSGRLSPERVEAMLLYLSGALEAGPVVSPEAA